MGKISGNTNFLNNTQKKRLEKLFKRRIPANQFIPFSIANTISKVSREIYKQIGVVFDRKGVVQYIIIGNDREILWPTFYEFHLNRFKLRGITAIHTHLHNKGLDFDDLTDLAYLRLDFICSINVNEIGNPEKIDIARLSVKNGKVETNVIFKGNLNNLNIIYHDEILKLENSLTETIGKNVDKTGENVFLVNVGMKSKNILQEEMDELIELSKAAKYNIVGTMIQRINKINPSLVLGKGKFKELVIKTIESNASKIIFYQDLTPAQAKFIADFVDIEVIDRTILILNIFARRAFTKEGKLKVELARLKYLLPRVVDKAGALSRIRGGIGIKGPGETVAEVERRRIKNRIKTIENDLKNSEKRRDILRRRREKQSVPVVSIIGYTNAGKSTLLNTLTKGDLFVENLVFATLETFSRKLFLDYDHELIVTDTVGFIKNLPKDLLDAFKSTLEELKFSDLLIHVVDISDENFTFNMETVETILENIGAEDIPQILVFNKIDKVEQEITNIIAQRYNGIPICAKDKNQVKPLIDYLKYFFQVNGKNKVENE